MEKTNILVKSKIDLGFSNKKNVPWKYELRKGTILILLDFVKQDRTYFTYWIKCFCEKGIIWLLCYKKTHITSPLETGWFTEI